MKGICLSLKTVNSDFWFLNFHNITFPVKVGSQLSAQKWVSVQPGFTGTLADFLPFFTYSESPLNSVLDKGLTCRNYSMDIEVMSVWKKLLPNARIRSLRGGHDHATSKTTIKHSNPTIILYKIIKHAQRLPTAEVPKAVGGKLFLGDLPHFVRRL